MTDFIKRNPLTTAHIATEVIVLGGLLYYCIQVNKGLTKSVMALEKRLSACEKALHPTARQAPHQPPRQASPPQARPPAPRPQPQPQPPTRQQPRHALPVIYEDDDNDVEVEEEEVLMTDADLDNEIDEELGKLIDFAST
jgi:hypothetical protein